MGLILVGPVSFAAEDLHKTLIDAESELQEGNKEN